MYKTETENNNKIVPIARRLVVVVVTLVVIVVYDLLLFVAPFSAAVAFCPLCSASSVLLSLVFFCFVSVFRLICRIEMSFKMSLNLSSEFASLSLQVNGNLLQCTRFATLDSLSNYADRFTDNCWI